MDEKKSNGLTEGEVLDHDDADIVDELKPGRAAALEPANEPLETPQKGDDIPASPTDSLSASQESGTPVVPVVVLIEDPVLEEQDGERQVAAIDSATPQKGGINPQEASVPVSPTDTTATTSQPTSEQSQRKRKRRRPVRVAVVEEHAHRPPLSASRLPPNQYGTVLRRRAIRKVDDGGSVGGSVSSSPLLEKSPKMASTRKQHLAAACTPARTTKRTDSDLSEASTGQYDEEYGDISLGMKLSIIGGSVIVQAVTPLDDGRASPAQLSGVVQRGDVLLSVDHASLVNLSLAQLVDGLKPLSSPQPDGSYRRMLHLRFAMGEGMKLLKKSETSGRKNDSMEGDIFSPLSQFMPMVDQLSGQPLFDEHKHAVPVATPVRTNRTDALVIASTSADVQRPKLVLDPDIDISVTVAGRLNFDRQKYTSEFFVWDDLQPELLRVSAIAQCQSDDIRLTPLTRSEIMKRGAQVMRGAKAVFRNVEELDVGKDKLSLGRFSSTLSWSSSRRRYGSTAANSIAESKQPSDDLSEESGDSGEQDEADGEEMLLHLAARDEIWRKELLESLAKSANDLVEGDHNANIDESNSTEHQADPGISLGQMFLGVKVSKMLDTTRTHHALPPVEVTSLLYDLIARLLDTPEEIDLMNGARLESRTHLVPFHKTRRIMHDDETLLAASFLADQALPAWLKSFRPLPWDQRGLLWPKGEVSSNTGGSHLLTDDGLTTLDSDSFGDMPHTSKPRKKTLEERIEEKELDAESRNETCYLVTFYFNRHVLPSLSGTTDEDAAVEFTERFGAYLKLHDCLLLAAIMHARTVIDSLISLARYDWKHQEALKEITKPGALILYDRTMLSAILKKLQGIRVESIPGRRRDVIVLCASAYPDLLPWQVREACLPDVGSLEPKRVHDEFEQVYYMYLSLLLHPSEGNEAARKDGALVQEWCEHSIRVSTAGAVGNGDGISDRKHNFEIVTSQKSGHLYSRDLPALLELGMKGEEGALALGLADTILDDPVLRLNKDVVVGVREALNVIAKEALDVAGTKTAHKQVDTQRLQRVFRLYDKMSTSSSSVCRQSIVVSEELHSLLMECSEGQDTKKEHSLVELIARNADPNDALQAFALWADHLESSRDTVLVLHTLLQRGVQAGISTELSGSLLRVNHARQTGAARRSFYSTADVSLAQDQGNVWRRMFDGAIPVDK